MLLVVVVVLFDCLPFAQITRKQDPPARLADALQHADRLLETPGRGMFVGGWEPEVTSREKQVRTQYGTPEARGKYDLRGSWWGELCDEENVGADTPTHEHIPHITQRERRCTKVAQTVDECLAARFAVVLLRGGPELAVQGPERLQASVSRPLVTGVGALVLVLVLAWAWGRGAARVR